MKVECTKCGYSAEVSAALQGEKVRCPKCLTEIVAGGDVGFTSVANEEIARLDLTKKSDQPEYLVLTNRHLKGEIINFASNGGFGIPKKKELDTLLSKVSSATIWKGPKRGTILSILIILLIILVGFAVFYTNVVSGHRDEALLLAGGIGVVIYLFWTIVGNLGKLLCVPSHGVSFQVIDTVYNVRLRDDLPETQKEAVAFIELLRKKKEEFERGV